MKRKTIIAVTAGVLTLSLFAACGKNGGQEAATQVQPAAEEQTEEKAEEPAEPAAEEQEEESMVGMANPWVDITEEEANALVMRLFKVPEGGKVLDWTKCEDLGDPDKGISPMVQLNFQLDDRYFNARAQQGISADTDISGLYMEWTVGPEDATLANWGGGNMKGKMYRSINDTGYVDLITWYDEEIGISYALSVADKDLDGFDIQAVAEQMYAEEAEPFGFGPTDFVQYQSGRLEFKDYDDVISCLKSGQGYTKIKLVGSDTEILALAEQVDGEKKTSKEITLYTMKDGVPFQLGNVMSKDSPIRLADGILYAGDEHSYETSFLTPDGAGIMMKDYVYEDSSSGTAAFGGFTREKNDFDSTADYKGDADDFAALVKARDGKPVLEFTIVK
ncbi:MAG: hypothetical protein K6G16_10630 [Lachnospiraceae bacterium]|nr:hypothetical protein [Lachnospiraceae bacterium]